MPFKSKAQERAAFGGYLGKEMQGRAKQWASETPNQSALPEHVKPKSKKKVGMQQGLGAKSKM